MSDLGIVKAITKNADRQLEGVGNLTNRYAPYVDAFNILLMLVFVSAVWFESDAYRYAGVLLSLIGLTHYYLNPDKPSIGLMEQLCIAWACYVGLRLSYNFIFYRELGLGSAEGIYLLPMLYSTVGYAFLVFSTRPFLLASAFISVSCLTAVASLDLSALQTGYRAWSGFHQNPIHAAIGMGMIVLCMLPFAYEAMRHTRIRVNNRWGLATMAIATFFLGIANIFGLQSKGVWLSLGVALPLQAMVVSGLSKDRLVLHLTLGCVIAGIASVTLLGDGIWTVAEGTFRATLSLTSDIGAGGGLMDSVARAINDPDTPTGFRERLMLWASAVEIWARAPLFGHGVGWLHFWQDRAYPQIDFNLLHNGYLEIAIRYGITGLVFYFAFFTWAARRVWQACRRGLISPAAVQSYVPLLVFFAMTITTNSNVRLAIGESFMWCAASFAFYCHFLMREVDSGNNRRMFLSRSNS